MRDFLISMDYSSWVLPALLLIPLIGAAVLLLVGLFRDDDGTLDRDPSARSIAFWTLLIEFVVSAGLW